MKLHQPWQRWALAIVLAAALPLGIVLLVRLSHGSVVIQLSDPKADVTVRVDGNIIEIGRLDEPLSLLIGEHELTIEGKHFVTTAKFGIFPGENEPIIITLAPPVRSHATRMAGE